MTVLTYAQLELDVPDGWEARAFSRAEDGEGERTYSVLHLANFPLPARVEDYGGGAVERMGPNHVFIALIEFGPESANTALFSQGALPAIDRRDFDPNLLHRGLQGQSAVQRFFTLGGRPYCLYIVLGDHLMRLRAAPAVNAVLRGLRFAS